MRAKQLLIYLVWALQVVVGVVFVLSALAKANDPLGMALLMQNYLGLVGVQTAHGSVAVTSMAVCLALVEMGIGVYLLVGSSRRRTASVLLLFMLVMTAITAYNAFTNAVPECGCFGTAVQLSNEASFGKNIILTTAATILFWRAKNMYQMPGTSLRVMSTTISSVLILILSLWTWHDMPLVDFTPYRVNTDIMTAMMGEYDVVDGQSVEIQAPTIRDFALTTADGDDVTDEILLSTDTITFITVPDECSADTGHSDRLNTLWDQASDGHHPFYIVMAGDISAAERFKDRTGLICPTLYASQEMLHAMVRANPGMVVLHKGHLIYKDRIR